MQLARVVGNATSTVKHPSIEGWKLLVVQPLDHAQRPVGRSQVAVDAVQAGPGDLVHTVQSREAALACRMLNIRKVVPLHFGTFPPLTGRPEQLKDLLGDEGTEVWTLEPGTPAHW